MNPENSERMVTNYCEACNARANGTPVMKNGKCYTFTYSPDTCPVCRVEYEKIK